MRRRLARLSWIAIMTLLMAEIGGRQSANAAVLPVFVKPAGLSSGACDSWENACNLQYALGHVATGDVIWVRKGLYRPTEDNTNRFATFAIPAGVEVYGGFDEADTLLTDRDWLLNRTILSGDIDRNDQNTDGNKVAEKWAHIKGQNSYNVVTMTATPAVKILADTILDGFIITAGQTEGVYTGGGLLCSGLNTGNECSPTLRNLIFSGNRAYSGGGLSNLGNSGGVSSPTLANVTFRGNYAVHSGGALYNDGSHTGMSNPRLTDVTFSGNYSAGYGGAMHNYAYDLGRSSPALTNVTFTHNDAMLHAGAIYNDAQDGGTSSPGLINVTLQGNSAQIGGAMYSWTSYAGTSSPTLTNVTFSANSATYEAGALYFGGVGTGTSAPSLTNVILWNDTASNGPEIYNYGTALPSINYSIVKGGDSGIGGDSGLNAFSVGTNNLDADPKLSVLGNNGGRTQTMTLKMGSPAADAGTNTGCSATDQRALARPQGAVCDIGAVEGKYMTKTFRSQGANDGWVMESAQGSGVGGSRNSTSTTFTIGDDGVNRQYMTILSFNTAGLPDAATLPAAQVKIKRSTSKGSNSGWVFIDLAHGSFGTAVLQNADFEREADAYDGQSMSTLLLPPSGWYTGTLHEFAAINKTGITQLRLYYDTPTNGDGVSDYLECYSGNAPTADRPMLIVTYIAP